MRIIFLVAILSALMVTASVAQDNAVATAPPSLTVVVSPQEQAGWDQIPTAMEQCVGAHTLGGDTAICKTIYTFLKTYSDRMKAAK